PLRELHSQMPDSATRTEDHDCFASLHLQHVGQALQSSHCVTRHHRQPFHAQLLRRAADILGIHGSIFGGKAALRVKQNRRVNTLALSEFGDVLAGGGDRARTISAYNVRKFGWDIKHLRETALTLQNIPHTNAGGLDTNQYFVGAWFRHGHFLYLDLLNATELFDNSGAHRFWNVILSHKLFLTCSDEECVNPISGSRSTMFRLIATYFAGDKVCTASMASHFAINISKHSDAGDVLLAPSHHRLEHIS